MNTADYYQSDRAEIARLLPQHYKRVLEIGCGEANFSRHLNSNCEIWGVEPNPQAAKIAVTKLSKVLVGRYDEIIGQLPKNYFDLIICNDVIEHMADHDWFFDSILQNMTPDAILVGSIPNVRHIRTLFELIVKKDWRYVDRLTLDRTHLRFFTEKSLRRTLNEHGFIIEELVGLNGTQRPINHVILFLINLVTLWRHRDIEHLNFAFRLRRATRLTGRST